MPTAVSEVSAAQAQMRLQAGQPVERPPQAPPPAPSETQAEIDETKKKLQALRDQIKAIEGYREAKFKESTSDTIMAMMLETTEEGQKSDSPPVDEFDAHNNGPEQGFSMSQAMRARSIDAMRELVYGPSLGDMARIEGEIRVLRERLFELEQQLEAEKNPKPKVT